MERKYGSIIGLNASFQEFMHVYTAPMHSQIAFRTFIQFVSASAPRTHVCTPKKKRLILIILQCECFPYFCHFSSRPSPLPRDHYILELCIAE